MKLLTKALAAALAACLMLSPAAMMEGDALSVEADAIAAEAAAPVGDDAAITPEAVDEAVEETEREAAEDAPADQSDADWVDLVEEADPADAGSPLLFDASTPATSNRLAVSEVFPDAVLRNAVTQQLYAENGTIDPDQLSDRISLSLTGLKDATGLDKLTGLTSLSIYSSPLTALFVSANVNLTLLTVKDCSKLTALDVTGNSRLTSLLCNCPITTLDLSGCPNLEVLDVVGTGLGLLDLTGCEKLIRCVREGTYKETNNSQYGTYEYKADGGVEYRVSTSPGLDITLGEETVPPETTKDIGQETAAAAQTAAAETPAANTISATSNTRITLYAAPGETFTLDLAGSTGKAFKSSRKKVATVNGSGVITIRGAGKARITFRVGKKKRSVTLTVKDPTVPSSVAITPVNTDVKKGERVTLTPVIPAGTHTGYLWRSSNRKVATVKGGVVTFKRKGRVTITCTARRGGKKAKIRFTVGNP